MSDGFLARKLAEGAAAFRLYGVGPSGASRTLLERWSTALPLPEICDQVEAKAKAFVETLGGNQAFQIVALDNSEKEIGSDVFRLQAEGPIGTAGLMTEPANEGGLVQQAMRHTEAFARTILQQQAQTDKVSTRMMERILARNEQLEARVVSSIELMGKMARDENAQAIEMYKAKVSAESKHEITKKLTAMIPIVMDTVALKLGGKTVGDTTLTNAVGEIFHGLNGDQLQAMMGILSPQQRIQVMHVMKRLAQQEEDAKPKTDAPEVSSTDAPAAPTTEGASHATE